MGLHAADGSFNIVLDTDGSGLYSPEGAYRATSSIEPPGTHERDGSIRVVFGSPGKGIYDKSGSLRVSTESGLGLHDSTGAYRVTILNDPDPEDPEAPTILYPISTSGTESFLNYTSNPDGTYNVTSNQDGNGIRFKFDLSQLEINVTYTARFTLSNIDAGNGDMYADVCDDSTQGPFVDGENTFTFSRNAYTTTYRFIDVYVDQNDDEGGTFTINTLQIEKPAS